MKERANRETDRENRETAAGEARIECAPHAAGVSHHAAEKHHHHTHATSSHHPGGHHLLTVEHLGVSFTMYDPAAPFFSGKRMVSRAIRDLSISVHVGEVLAVVGASGSGKTLLADAILGLSELNARVTGSIWFDGVPQDAASLARLRGNGIALVPQSVSHLDPLMRVGDQIVGFKARSRAEKHARRARMRGLMEAYGLDRSVERLYPHELSGGMARRVLLLSALIDEPRLIVADEPTPGLDLDLAVQALGDLRSFANQGGGVLLITHDLELALRIADRVAVFRDGTVVEETAVGNFARPELLEHPFSRALWHAMPEHGFDVPAKSGEQLAETGGSMP